MICLINRKHLVFKFGKSYKGIKIGYVLFVPYEPVDSTYIIVRVRDIDTVNGIVHCYDMNTDSIIPYAYDYLVKHNKRIVDRINK